MPILETVVGGYFVGKGAMIAGTAVSGFVVAAGGYLFGRSSAGKESEEAKAQLVRLTEIKEEREDARVQNFHEMVGGLEQRKLHLDEEALKHRQQMESLATGFDKDSSVMHEQTEVLGRTNLELEQCVKDQQAMLLALKQELHEKMEAFDRNQKELMESKARFEDTSKELTEAKLRIESTDRQQEETRQELTQLKDQVSILAAQNEKKDLIISSCEKKIKQQAQDFENELTQSNKKIHDLTDEVESCNQLIETLSEQLEQAKLEKRAPSPTPRFFINAIRRT